MSRYRLPSTSVTHAPSPSARRGGRGGGGGGGRCPPGGDGGRGRHGRRSRRYRSRHRLCILEASPVPVPVLDTRTLNRTLLARQLLLARVTTPPLQVIEHLVGLQAQVPTSPYIALWSRIESFDPEAVGADVLEGRLVRMALMRSTIHLVTVEDALSLRAVMQPVLDAELYRNRTWSVGLEGVDLGKVLAVGRALVEERPRPLGELRVAMAGRFPANDATTPAYA